MLKFEKVIDKIYRLCIPFENIYTGVFLIETESGSILLDSASNAGDVKNYILPALAEKETDPSWLILSHTHGDHAGGLPCMISRFPNANIGLMDTETLKQHSEWNGKILHDGDILLDCIKILNLPGHTSDSLGLLDMRSNTLLSGDALQLCGIGRYGTGITNADKYTETLSSLTDMNIDNIIASHNYVPLGYLAVGKENSKKYITECINYASKLQSFVNDNRNMDTQMLTQLYNSHNQCLPPVPETTIKSFECH